MIAALTLALLTMPGITVDLDLRDVPRSIVHARVSLDASGPLTLVYPKWIPGTHAPSGPIGEFTSLVIRSGDRTLAWHRDPVDLYAFHVDAPWTSGKLDISFDVVSTPGRTTTTKLGIFEWSRYLLYPRGSDARTLSAAARVTLPRGWDAAGALDVETRSGAQIRYAPATLERLVDSPILAGANLQRIPLADGEAPVTLVVASDLPAATVDPKVVEHFRTLVTQAQLLFGARHWRRYTFLLTLSDAIGYGGLEHGESSWNGVTQDGLANEREAKHYAGSLLAHEFTHSWDGKYRRPAGLTQPDFQAPYQTGLLWVYEGLTQYIGDVLATRSGFYDENEFLTILADKQAALDVEPGRAWRPLVDTAVAEEATRSAPPAWSNQRRGTDYYSEGELIWMEADALIRLRTNGTRSLDDFSRAFFGGGNTGPVVVPYTRSDVMAAMSAVYAYDWPAFFAERVDHIAPRAPLALESVGWRIAYAAAPADPEALRPVRRTPPGPDLRYAIGALLGADGTLTDVLTGSASERAGLTPRMKIVAVDGRVYRAEALRSAIGSAKAQGSIQLLVEAPDGTFSMRTVSCDGPRYPRAERDPGKADLAAAILAPLH